MNPDQFLLKLDFLLDDKVRIAPLERVGKVVAIWHGDIGTQYHVRYFDNASPQVVYFNADELQLVERPDPPEAPR